MYDSSLLQPGLSHILLAHTGLSQWSLLRQKQFHSLLRVNYFPFIQDKPNSKQFIAKKKKKHSLKKKQSTQSFYAKSNVPFLMKM